MHPHFHNIPETEIPRRWGPFRSMILTFIRLYQKYLSPILGRQCRFYPTCSSYAELLFMYYPLWVAIPKSLDRIVRCNPYNPGGLDIPEKIPEEIKKSLQL